MKRILIGVVGLYLVAAIATSLAERSGAWKRCGCERSCWCKRPGLSLFRWVVPFRWHHLLSADDKRALAEAHGGPVASPVA